MTRFGVSATPLTLPPPHVLHTTTRVAFHWLRTAVILNAPLDPIDVRLDPGVDAWQLGESTAWKGLGGWQGVALTYAGADNTDHPVLVLDDLATPV